MKIIEGVIIEQESEIGATIVGSFSYCQFDKIHKAQVKKEDHRRFIERRRDGRRTESSNRS